MEYKQKYLKKNYRVGRHKPISEITIHHTAGNITLATLYNVFSGDRKASSHYGVRDNEVYQYVRECDTAWTNSSGNANARAITIEVVNNVSQAPWTVSNYSFNTLVELVYDIAKRNNLLPLVKGKNLTWHRLYAKTICPSDFLINRIDEIVAKVNTQFLRTKGEIKK